MSSSASTEKPGIARKNFNTARYIHLVIIVALFVVIGFLFTGYYYDLFQLSPGLRNIVWYLNVFEFRYDMFGLPFYVPMIYAALIFGLRGSLISWFSTILIILPVLIEFSTDDASWITNIIFMTVPLIAVAAITLQLRWIESERRQSRAREENKKMYLAQILKAHEEERHRIAQELHDDTLHSLLFIANQAQLLTKNRAGTDEQTETSAIAIKETAFTLSEDLRRLSYSLHPSILDDMGLGPALIWLVDRFNQSNESQAEILVEGASVQLPKDTEVIIFRIVQEALNNVHKHSQATEVHVSVKFKPEKIYLKIQDNGVGFNPACLQESSEFRSKLGLNGISQRAELVNGNLAIKSARGEGTTISLEIPCP